MAVIKRDLLEIVEQLVLQAIRRVDADLDYVITSGKQWTYGYRFASEPGFSLRSWGDPLRGVAVVPLKLARRITEFSGGHIVKAADHLEAVLTDIRAALAVAQS